MHATEHAYVQHITTWEGIMARIVRRRLLKLAASGAVAAQTGGLAADETVKVYASPV